MSAATPLDSTVDGAVAGTVDGAVVGRSPTRSLPVAAIVTPIVFFAVFLGAWQLLVRVADIQVLLLPAPTDIAARFFADFGLLWELARNTAYEAFRGVLIGSVLGIAVAGLTQPISWLNKGLLSYSSTVKALPVVALYPITTVFFGVSATAVVAMVTIAVTPIMFTYASRGFSGTSEHDELMRSISAGPLTRFWSLTLPRALPYVMAGLKTIVPLSIIIAIISEYFGGSVTTLGSYIRRESTNLHTVDMWSAIVMACALGIGAFVVVSLLDRVLLRRHRGPGT
jgi:NitT/TauT family transport system permease protein